MPKCCWNPNIPSKNTVGESFIVGGDSDHTLTGSEAGKSSQVFDTPYDGTTEFYPPAGPGASNSYFRIVGNVGSAVVTLAQPGAPKTLKVPPGALWLVKFSDRGPEQVSFGPFAATYTFAGQSRPTAGGPLAAYLAKDGNLSSAPSAAVIEYMTVRDEWVNALLTNLSALPPGPTGSILVEFLVNGTLVPGASQTYLSTDTDPLSREKGFTPVLVPAGATIAMRVTSDVVLGTGSVPSLSLGTAVAFDGRL